MSLLPTPTHASSAARCAHHQLPHIRPNIGAPLSFFSYSYNFTCLCTMAWILFNTVALRKILHFNTMMALYAKMQKCKMQFGTDGTTRTLQKCNQNFANPSFSLLWMPYIYSSPELHPCNRSQIDKTQHRLMQMRHCLVRQDFVLKIISAFCIFAFCIFAVLHFLQCT